jgi:hypothetical protein
MQVVLWLRLQEQQKWIGPAVDQPQGFVLP